MDKGRWSKRVAAMATLLFSLSILGWGTVEVTLSPFKYK